jgi:23S rRNA (uracil1939-C5)-methyltransferase
MKITCTKLVDLVSPITEPKSYLKYLLPGEVVEVADIKSPLVDHNFIVKSPHRIRVKCPIFDACGGCDFLHVDYLEQCRLKQAHVENLYRSLHYSREIMPMIVNPSPLHYRHKVVLSATTKKNKLRLGLYREGSKDVIPFLGCLIHDKETNLISASIEELLNQYKITAYDIDSGKGIIKHILMRKSYHDGSILMVFVINGTLFPNSKPIIQELMKRHGSIKTVVQNIHRKKTHLVLLEEEKVLYGSGYIHDQIGDLTFRLSSRSFYQVNPLQMMKLYQVAIDLLDIKLHETVVDTYSGIGTLSLLAAKKAKHVIAIEVNKKSHEDAVFNKSLNKINNISFINDDVERVIGELNQKVDVLLMDPTREGASKAFMEKVLVLKPKRIAYISCEPKTQVRDIEFLLRDYEIKHVQPVDMFSQTRHVESISLLLLK